MKVLPFDVGTTSDFLAVMDRNILYVLTFHSIITMDTGFCLPGKIKWLFDV